MEETEPKGDEALHDPRKEFIITNALNLLGKDCNSVKFSVKNERTLFDNLAASKPVDLFLNDYNCTHLTFRALKNDKVR